MNPRALTLAAITALLGAPLVLAAGALPGPLEVFSNGTVADADVVNDNFAALGTAVNDNAAKLAGLQGLSVRAFSGVTNASTSALVLATSGGNKAVGGSCRIDSSNANPHRALIGPSVVGQGSVPYTLTAHENGNLYLYVHEPNHQGQPYTCVVYSLP